MQVRMGQLVVPATMSEVHLRRSSNRGSASIVLGAVCVGSALLVSSYVSIGPVCYIISVLAAGIEDLAEYGMVFIFRVGL